MKTHQAPTTSNASDRRPIHQAVGRLTELGTLRASAMELRRTANTASEDLRRSVLLEVEGFTASKNPEIILDFEQHAKSHVEAIVLVFEGAESPDFEFVKAHARRRAQQRFPLEATLHAYRCGLKVLSRWMREAAIASTTENTDHVVAGVADFAIEYTNAISSIAAAEYVSHTRALAEAEGDRRAELFNLLLSGYDESDQRVARVLKQSGYLDQRHSYCVAVVRSTDRSEMERPERVERLTTAVIGAIAPGPIRFLTGVRGSVVTLIASAMRRQSGWTAPQTNLAQRLHSSLLGLGPSVLAGISSDQPSTSFIPRALQEALVALDSASVTRRVSQFSELPLRSLMVLGSGDYLRSVAPRWVAAFLAADLKADGALVTSLRALADADLNVQKASRKLGVHANTLYIRLERIRELTGLDARRHHDLVELLLTVDCVQG